MGVIPTPEHDILTNFFHTMHFHSLRSWRKFTSLCLLPTAPEIRPFQGVCIMRGGGCIRDFGGRILCPTTPPPLHPPRLQKCLKLERTEHFLLHPLFPHGQFFFFLLYLYIYVINKLFRTFPPRRS